jgi:hypothetical protein
VLLLLPVLLLLLLVLLPLLFSAAATTTTSSGSSTEKRSGITVMGLLATSKLPSIETVKVQYLVGFEFYKYTFTREIVPKLQMVVCGKLSLE